MTLPPDDGCLLIVIAIVVIGWLWGKINYAYTHYNEPDRASDNQVHEKNIKQTITWRKLRMKKLSTVFLLLVGTSLALNAADGEAIYKSKCFSCHGDKASKAALNKSQIIAGWDAAKIIASLNG